MKLKFYRASYYALFLLILTACSKPVCRQWILQEILVDNPCFNSARMILGPDSETCHLELEIDRCQTGLRMYVNLLLLQAPPCPEDCNRSNLTILLEDGEALIVYPYILTGGQRLLMPLEVTDYLIQLLLDQQSFTIQLGRQRLTIILENFQMAYNQMMNIPLVENF